MDKFVDKEPPLTPIERIKHEHDFKRTEILISDEDEIAWDADISPEQVGLKPVYADDDGKLWTIVRDQLGLKLKRILTHVS